MPKISGGDFAHMAVSTLVPAVTLAGVLAAGSGMGQGHSTRVVFDVVAVGAVLWLAISLAWSATRPSRDRRAAEQLANLRAASELPNHALVLLQTSVEVASAGQHAVVVHIMTGERHTLWLPEFEAQIGSFLLLERQERRVAVVNWMAPRTVEAAHRFETRRSHEHNDERSRGRVTPSHRSREETPQEASTPRAETANMHPAEVVREVHKKGNGSLVREVEEFLRSQGRGQSENG